MIEPSRKKPVALIFGAGDALGPVIARRFAKEDYGCVARRSLEKLDPVGKEIRASNCRIRPFGMDARKEDQVVDLFAMVEREEGEIEVVVFNVGPNVQFDIRSTEAKKYFKCGSSRVSRDSLSLERPKGLNSGGRGSIIFSGATASWRENGGFAAFAGGRHGLRALAESMAKELAPQGTSRCPYCH